MPNWSLDDRLGVLYSIADVQYPNTGQHWTRQGKTRSEESERLRQPSLAEAGSPAPGNRRECHLCEGSKIAADVWQKISMCGGIVGLDLVWQFCNSKESDES